MIYEKTEDKNIIRQIETVESEIHLDKLEKQVVDLENEIKDMPNEMIVPTDKERLKIELKKKKDLLNKLKGGV